MINADKQQEYIRRLMGARMLMLSRDAFFGLLLMHMKFALDESEQTAATDGERIFFGPAFLDTISDEELYFVLMHEIMHVVLRHTFRTGDRAGLAFNIACDIVVNSNILEAAGGDLRSITLAKYGESMHIAPDGKEGWLYTAEEVYEMLPESIKRRPAAGNGSRRDSGDPGSGSRSGSGSGSYAAGGFRDGHSKWGTSDEQGLEAVWRERIRGAYEASRSRNAGSLPGGIERAIKELLSPKTDWRILLNDFVQEDITDYSFTPPDRRYGGSPFFLPDFNETDQTVRNILFWIDTSGSMTDEEITTAYSEIKGAIDQFGGRLEGRLGFFDAEVIPPEPFSDENGLKIIRPRGGGGTRFDIIFDYIREEMTDIEISAVIIMTDGYADFPDESEAMGLPVLWMINNDNVTPPWGRIARI